MGSGSDRQTRLRESPHGARYEAFECHVRRGKTTAGRRWPPARESERARAWEPLRCFRLDDERERRARAERAEEVLLTGLTDAVKRK